MNLCDTCKEDTENINVIYNMQPSNHETKFNEADKAKN